MIQLNVDYLPYADIAQRAVTYLIQHNLDKAIPVLIEEFIEFELGKDIVPLPNLQKDYEIEGFTSSDLSTIYVDDYVYTNRPTRYRYTLAHELGHIVLHGEFYKQLKFDGTLEWMRFISELDEKDHSSIEFQGYAFGGLILVPPHHLRPLFEENLSKIQPLVEQARKGGVNRNGYFEYAIEKMASALTAPFDVSSDVIVRRIKYDSLQRLIV